MYQLSSLHKAVLGIVALAVIAFLTLQRYEAEVHMRHRSALLKGLNGTLTTLNYELRMMDNRHKGLDKRVRVGDVAGDKAAPNPTPSLTVVTKNKAREIKQIPPLDAEATTKLPPLSSSHTKKGTMKALIFTMDSITAYEDNSLHGGAAGELLIRRCLTTALQDLGVRVKTMKSDSEFERSDAKSYDFIILDTWTWAAQGWVPKACIRGLDAKIYILDFFGSEKLRGSGLVVPKERFLTAYGSPWNTFLGYFMLNPSLNPSPNLSPNEEIMKPSSVQQQQQQGRQKRQGVVWGKDPKHLKGHVDLLKKLADDVHLVSTASSPLFNHPNVEWRGHAAANEWRPLLAESSFLIGLGDPLLGPSAIDCISVGCMFINPTYNKPVLGRRSQHDYADKAIGEPYVCSYQIDNYSQAKACVEKALVANLNHTIPADFRKAEYYKRVKDIFRI